MKIQCDVCEKAPAAVICCAEEAALCGKCDLEVHAANKLASKHQRLLLQSLSNKLPNCDICQEKPAFVFCVEDRALFCQDCDEPIHSANKFVANHQRFLATGIRVALGPSSTKETEKSYNPEPKPPSQDVQQITSKRPLHQASTSIPSSWTVDDLFRFSDFESSDKPMQKVHHLEDGDLEWLTEINLFGDRVPLEPLVLAEVPQFPFSQMSNIATSDMPMKSNIPYKKPRFGIPEEDEEYFTVPDVD